MNTLAQMEQLLQEMRLDAQKLYQNNTKLYAVRLREKAGQMKVLSQLVRTEALAHRDSIVGHGKNKTVGGVQITAQASTEVEPELDEQPAELPPVPTAVYKRARFAKAPVNPSQ